MSFEYIDRRVLGAVQPVDVNTRLPIGGPFSIAGEDIGFQRNRSGLQVIMRAKGFEEYTLAFQSPPAHAGASFPLTAGDPTGRYLPRLVSLALPRSPDPEADNSVFRPFQIAMYPSPTAALAPGLAVIRAVILKGGAARERLPWALVTVRQASDDTVLARALADCRGEVLVAVPGLPLVAPSETGDEVEASTVDVNIDITIDPAAVAAELEARRQNRHAIVNPDEIAKLTPAVQNVARTLAAGQTIKDEWKAPFAGAGVVIETQ